jgi:hypothetical protein
MNPDQDGRSPFHLWDLLHLGYTLCKMESYTEESLIVSSNEGDWGVIDGLKALQSALERLELQDTDDQFRLRISPLVFRLEVLYDKCGETMLGDNILDLRDGLECLFGVVREEASCRDVYLVTPSKSLDLDRLIDEPGRYFGLPDLLDPPLPPEVDSSLREAGRCLAVGFGPAVVLFTLLATEAILRYYYERVTGEPVPEKLNWKPGWGWFCKKLSRSVHQCPQLVIELLSRIKDDYRNLAMHASLEMEGGMALSVWGICSRTVREMMKDLVTRGKVTAEWLD